MAQNNFNIQFSNQFCTPPGDPGKNQKRHGDIIYRQFAGRKNEIVNLAETLAQKLDDTCIINRLIVQLESKTIPAYFNLSHIAQTLKRRLTYYVRMKPLDSGHHSNELGLLKPFNRFIDGFQENMQQILLSRLKYLRNVQLEEVGIKPVNSVEIYRLITIQEKFLKKLNDYYQDLCRFSGQPLNRLPGFDIPTETELNNVRLSSSIQKLVHSVRITQFLLKSWKQQVASRESGQLLN